MGRGLFGLANDPAVLDRVVDGFHLQCGSVLTFPEFAAQSQQVFTEIQPSNEDQYHCGGCEEVEQIQHGTPQQ
jgi:hypothetical protein